MHPDHTTRVNYAELGRFVGYRFGDDGSAWSRWSRGTGGLTDRWRPLRTCGGSKCGHRRVRLYVDGVATVHYVHRLILEAFRGPCPEGMECCHYDGDASNNRLDNLRWDTREANREDSRRLGTLRMGSGHGMAKLTESDIPEIRRLYTQGMSLRRIGERFGVTHHMVRLIIQGKSWKQVP